jgi:hypothetical protein
LLFSLFWGFDCWCLKLLVDRIFYDWIGNLGTYCLSNSEVTKLRSLSNSTIQVVFFNCVYLSLRGFWKNNLKIFKLYRSGGSIFQLSSFEFERLLKNCRKLFKLYHSGGSIFQVSSFELERLFKNCPELFKLYHSGGSILQLKSFEFEKILKNCIKIIQLHH